ncbi:MAG: carboxypeptidase regulatory-like domain-containing protein [Flavobacteriales bacterium]|nr:carboxypeptidase regulatory-like domain-containing protein [Flavobacteriales bacterium]
MKKLLLLLFCMPFLMATSCEDDSEELIFCTTEYVYGLKVTVKDAQTNLNLTTGVTVTAVDGSYSENLELLEFNDYFIGAGERPGNYIITVSKSGYQTFTTNTITLTADVCHVIPQQLVIELTPL